jgi:hypothetical protein
MVMPHIETIENGLDVSPGPFHDQFIFSHILPIIPVDKIIFETREAGYREDGQNQTEGKDDLMLFHLMDWGGNGISYIFHM